MKRLRAAERFRPYAATRVIGALEAEFGPLPREQLLGDPALAAAERGGRVSRETVARMRKRLIKALCTERLDHRSGAFQKARSAVLRAVTLERL